MKFSVHQSALLQLTQTVSKAVAVRTTKQVLTGILLEATEDTLRATAYDLELGIQDEIIADEQSGLRVEQPGAIVLPARYLSEVVRKLPLADVTVTIQNNYVAEIQSGQAQFHLHGIDAAEFPKLPLFHNAERIEIPSYSLKRLIQSTAFAAATSEVRPVLTGIHLQLENQHITFTATDALRLAVRTAALNSAENQNWNVILPSKSLTELAKILPDDDSLIQVQCTNTHSLFAVGSTLFYTRLIDGAYPDTSRIIPSQFRTEITLPTSDITNAIDRAVLIARDRDNNQVRFDVGADFVTISSSSAEIGNVAEQVGILQKTGDDLQIAFNGKNVLDALRTIQGEEVILRFNGANQPFIFQEEGEPSALQLISPVLTR
ncbi:DNA polymerase III subunit beta [Alicyclobacillus cycloheptanicus]|uniref:Beta sliding clamp n=1 Tax=Alicyclobacillus cycloheptanicus TaxID=1457 RepID=A0ABT9XMK3_9BACL|nr:DNA polymerase III subunit beta [Alicyclobacillus cycloheptanicus]MDQ0190953.1 DNA polymerase-3 subunit beta [Alicyclobacillus cycloheptanicus]WDM02402.1 DNA polymerase III subunit beta [Alicyclobacillus cycloheptanicus]